MRRAGGAIREAYQTVKVCGRGWGVPSQREEKTGLRTEPRHTTGSERELKGLGGAMAEKVGEKIAK